MPVDGVTIADISTSYRSIVVLVPVCSIFSIKKAVAVGCTVYTATVHTVAAQCSI